MLDYAVACYSKESTFLVSTGTALADKAMNLGDPVMLVSTESSLGANWDDEVTCDKYVLVLTATSVLHDGKRSAEI